MKRKTVLLLIFSLFLLLHTTSFAQKEKLPLGTGEWPPYTSIDLEGYGFFPN